MSRRDLAIVIVQAVWLALVIVRQIAIFVPRLRPWGDRLRKMGIVPAWTLFAPRPTVADFDLLCRDQLADGSWTEWAAIDPHPPRRLWHLVWHPAQPAELRLDQLVPDLASLAQSAKREDDPPSPFHPDRRAAALTPDLVSSVAYRVLLSRARSSARLPGARRTQFALFKSNGLASREPALVLLSAAHEL